VNYYHALITEDAIQPSKQWIPALAASILFHLAIFFLINLSLLHKDEIQIRSITRPITVILLKKPTYQKPAPDIEKESAQPSIQGKKASIKNAKPLQSLKNSKAVKPQSAKDQTPIKPIATTNHTRIVADIIKKNETKTQLPGDWANTAKEVIRETVEKETIVNQQQGELWLKSPSEMHGKPKDYFDRQDKKAMLADTNDSDRKSIFPSKKQKSEGQVIRLGKLCFHRPTFAEKADIRADSTVVGMLIPVSCDF
jgi:hypothetical protein